MIRYYRLFDLLRRRGLKKSDLRKILSPKTVAKLSKGQYISGEAIDKICTYLKCQPGDIMEVVQIIRTFDNTQTLLARHYYNDSIAYDFDTKTGNFFNIDARLDRYYDEPINQEEIKNIHAWYDTDEDAPEEDIFNPMKIKTNDSFDK